MTEITDQQVADGLAAFFVEGVAGPATLLGSGYESDVYSFDLTSGGERDELVLRVYGGSGAGEKATREFRAMQALRVAGYPIPRVAALNPDASPLGRPFLVMTRVEGVSLGKQFWSEDSAARLSASELHGRLMAGLHRIPARSILPNDPLANAQSGTAFIDDELLFLAGMQRDLDRRAPSALWRVLEWLGERRSSMSCGRLAVGHGDFHPNNVLVSTDDHAVVIDWSNARIADPRTDIAWFRLIALADRNPVEASAFLRAYEQEGECGIREIEVFEVLAAARLLLSTLLSLRFGSARQGMRPQAVDLMRRGGDFAHYLASGLQERTAIPTLDLHDALDSALV